MRRSEAAQAVGVHPDTLLNLERSGHVTPIRDRNGHRHYTEEQIQQLRAIYFPNGAPAGAARGAAVGAA